MVKRRNVIFGVVVFLVIAAIVVVIVLDALGYFKTKNPGGSNPTSHATTCIPPTITGVVYSRDSNNTDTYNVQLTNLLENCGDFSNNGSKIIYYDLQLYQNGKPLQGTLSMSDDFTKSFFIARPGGTLPSGNYTADISVGFQFNAGPLYSKPFNFSFTVN
jgi:hypothetical protein